MENRIDWSWANKYLDDICGDFYNPRKALSRKRPFVLVQSARSSGKSTSFAVLSVLNYLKKGKKTIYTRRTEEETLHGARDFYVDACEIISTKYPEFKLVDVYYEANKLYIERITDDGISKEEFGRTVPLSMVYKRKSMVSKGDINLIIYDEYVAIADTEYLGTKDNILNEYDRLINLYQTVDRSIGHAVLNQTTVVCLGNSTTIYNPIHLGLDLVKYIQNDSRFIAPKNKLYVLERFSKVKATEAIESSFSYQLSSESEKLKMYQNQTGEMTGTYICKKPQQAELVCQFILDKKTYEIYYSYYKNVYWVTTTNSLSSTNCYSLDIDSHEATSAELAARLNDWYMADVLCRAYKKGSCYFSNGGVQRQILSYLKLN